jgi:UDP-N-acetylmuramyl tripeptide synthase
VHLSLPGHFNLANAAMAAAAAADAGADPVAATAAMNSIREVAGRYACVDVGGRRLRLLLAKNPAGWVELLDLVGSGGTGPLVLAFNSDGVDGRDPSWLYDVPFEDLRGREVVVIGRRATDLRVRLELDGIRVRTVRGRLLDALADLPPGPVDVLANYTAFQDVRRELAGVRE